MKRTIGLLTSGAIALGLISFQCSSDGGDDDPNPSAGTGFGGAPIAGSLSGAGTAGTGLLAGAGSGGGGSGAGGRGGSGGTGLGGAPGGAPGGGRSGGAGTGGAAAGSGGSGGASGGTTGGGGSGGRGGATGTSGGGSGGSTGGGAGGGNAPAFSEVATLLNSRCATNGCHNAGQTMHNVLANNAGLYMRLTTQMAQGDCRQSTLVVPGNVENSFLAQIVQAATPCAGHTGNIGRMPFGCSGNSCLNAAQIETITDWIAAGAPQ